MRKCSWGMSRARWRIWRAWPAGALAKSAWMPTANRGQLTAKRLSWLAALEPAPTGHAGHQQSFAELPRRAPARLKGYSFSPHPIATSIAPGPISLFAPQPYAFVPPPTQCARVEHRVSAPHCYVQPILRVRQSQNPTALPGSAPASALPVVE